jgi:protocatechuate 3,4-dioxygenase beta subunit
MIILAPGDRTLDARRRALAWLSAGAASVVISPLHAAAQSRGSECTLRPAQMEGPFFLDERMNRSDIATDPTSGARNAGTPLRLTFNVGSLNGRDCAPLADAVVDVWHCDALGAYSGFNDGVSDTRGQRFLRGFQRTDRNGVATFQTIYPGWYSGRAVHIHFKIAHVDAAKRMHDFTSQLYFDDAVTDAVHASPAYARKGRRAMRNVEDGLYRRGGRELTLTPAQSDAAYVASFDVGLRLA